MKPSLVIIGLGNLGEKYINTRHNVGFLAVDYLAKKYATEEFHSKQKFLSEVCEGQISGTHILFVKPSTYMNNSGNAVCKLVEFYDLDPANQLIILCDDVDLLAGEMRLHTSGGAGSHNGLKSIVAIYGESFSRIRIGIRGSHTPEGSFQKAGEDLANYVLSAPEKEERKKIEECLGGLENLL